MNSSGFVVEVYVGARSAIPQPRRSLTRRDRIADQDKFKVRRVRSSNADRRASATGVLPSRTAFALAAAFFNRHGKSITRALSHANGSDDGLVAYLGCRIGLAAAKSRVAQTARAAALLPQVGRIGKSRETLTGSAIALPLMRAALASRDNYISYRPSRRLLDGVSGILQSKEKQMSNTPEKPIDVDVLVAEEIRHLAIDCGTHISSDEERAEVRATVVARLAAQ
jgi:hypothetical protein